MKNRKITKKNFGAVMDKIKEHFDGSDRESKSFWCDAMNEMLDSLLADDFFGTEGQCDVRGDQRD